jgi:ATP phosphoribosyltransferase regulatory subunit
VRTLSRILAFEKPNGMKDILPERYERKKQIRSSIERVMHMWGYRFVETPTLEYYETVGVASSIEDHQLFKLLDSSGRPLVLRPDMTTPIARLAASTLSKEPLPLRLGYCAPVFRSPKKEGGALSEFEQIGVEYIGDYSITADGEVVALLVSVLKEIGLEKFQVSIGHATLLQELLKGMLPEERLVSSFTQHLVEKNYVAFEKDVESLSVSTETKKRLLNILSLRGKEDVLSTASELLTDKEGSEELEQLSKLWYVLEDYEVSSFVQFDLTLVGEMNYYSGILFEVDAPKIGFPLGNGGRYDFLVEKFGRKLGATGFALRLDYVLEALNVKVQLPVLECVLFLPHKQREAIRFALQKRAEGIPIVLQPIESLDEIKLYSDKYKQIYPFFD